MPFEFNFVDGWWRKNYKKYPLVCVSQGVQPGRQNFMVVVSEAEGYFNGLDPVVRTYRDTTTTPFTVTGSTYDQYGGYWDYRFSGNIETTTTTTVQEDLPYTIHNQGVFVRAYNSNGGLITETSHIYSNRTGGDGYQSFGYNMGSLIAAAGAKGRMIKHVLEAINRVPVPLANSVTVPNAVVDKDACFTTGPCDSQILRTESLYPAMTPCGSTADTSSPEYCKAVTECLQYRLTVCMK